MLDDRLLELMQTCSNVGRWGADDERGTVNHITPAVVRAATALVRDGVTVSLAHDMIPGAGLDDGDHVRRRMIDMGAASTLACSDSVEIAPHGFACTHLDALGHVFFEGSLWNDRKVDREVDGEGLHFAAVTAFGEGIVTRGILLDVAAARGVDFVEFGDPVTPDDLDRAAARAGVQVLPGDAVFVRVGMARAPASAPGSSRAGLAVEVIQWLYDHDVAIYSGDCVEQLPSGSDRFPLPLHQVGMVAMGLVLLDNTDMERLSAACAAAGRSEFLLVCAPLPIHGGTGSAVNPIAVF